jgi:hypothetical protein
MKEDRKKNSRIGEKAPWTSVERHLVSVAIHDPERHEHYSALRDGDLGVFEGVVARRSAVHERDDGVQAERFLHDHAAVLQVCLVLGGHLRAALHHARHLLFHLVLHARVLSKQVCHVATKEGGRVVARREQRAELGRGE